jgi:hypothetical protein
MEPSNNKKYLLICSDIRPDEFGEGFNCSFTACYGRLEVEEPWPIPEDYIEFSRKGIRVRINELKKRRSKVEICVTGSKPKEFTVNTKDLEERTED